MATRAPRVSWHSPARGGVDGVHVCVTVVLSEQCVQADPLQVAAHKWMILKLADVLLECVTS